MTYLLMALSSFLGCFAAIMLWSNYQKMIRIKVMRELQKELVGKLETEMTFQQLASQIRADWEKDNGYEYE
jgi:hypothetical protein